jgi:uncharacterized membrane protein YvbJ
MMNKCNKCGKDNADNLKYCRWCGYELPKLKAEEIQKPVERPVKRVNYKKLTGMIVGAITFLVAYFLFSNYYSKPLIWIKS